jgi:hypothetical protein
MPAPNREQLMRHSFLVVESTIPDGLTIREWQRIRVTRRPGRHRLFK